MKTALTAFACGLATSAALWWSWQRRQNRVPFLCASEVRSALSFEAVIALMETCLVEFSRGDIEQPVRSVVAVPEHTGFMAVMPVYDKPRSSLGVKLVTFFRANVSPVSTHFAVIALFNSTTGEPRVLLDGDVVTEMRTAAVSAVAAKHLSGKNGPRHPCLAIVGSGVQARAHYHAMRAVFGDFCDVRVWSRSASKAKPFAGSIGARACATIAETLRGADIVCVCTSAVEPVVLGADVKAGAVVCAVGACRPDQREMDDQLLQSAYVVVDSRDAAHTESGDIILSGCTVAAELGEVVGDTASSQPADGQTRVFKSLGLAVEDSITAYYVARQWHY